MDAQSIVKHIADTFDGVDVVTASGDWFLFYDPRRDQPHDRRMPFVTLVTSDNYDKASNLSRPGVYRLNIGLGKDTYRSHFGPPPPFPKDGGVAQTGHDFTLLDTLLPHPIYAAMSWVCILNPSDEAFENVVRPLLKEAHSLAAGKDAKRAAREGS